MSLETYGRKFSCFEPPIANSQHLIVDSVGVGIDDLVRDALVVVP
jgi:hypothetical protein